MGSVAVAGANHGCGFDEGEIGDAGVVEVETFEVAACSDDGDHARVGDGLTVR